jgi:NADH-quinone oxidoreductase subunit H
MTAHEPSRPSLATALRALLPGAWSLWCLSLLLWLPACADTPSLAMPDPGVHLEPRELVFHPTTEPIRVAVVNHGSAPVTVANLRLEGADWDGFSIAGELAGETGGKLRPGQSAQFEVIADPAAFVTRNERGRPIGFREGMARLVLDADDVRVAGRVRFEEPSPLWQYIVPGLVKVLALVLAFIMPLATLMTWMERKQSAMMQDRLGPNRASITIAGRRIRLWGMLHMATDAVKMLLKEDFVPRHAHRVLYTIAPLLGFCTAMVVFTIVPFGDALCYSGLFEVLRQADIDQCAAGRGGTPLQVATIDVGLLFYFAIASLASYGATLAGWSSYNKFAILGSLRASAQMVSYEVAIGLTIVGALLVYGTLEPHALVRAQLDSFWGVALQPLGFILFFTAAIAETKRAPFDIPEGESEIVGYFIEYSGMRFGLFFLSEFIEVIFAAAIVTTLFFGGWALPFGILGASGFSSSLAAGAFLGATGAAITVMGALLWMNNKGGGPLGMVLASVGLLHVFLALWALFSGWGTAIPHIAIVLIGMLTWGAKVFLLCVVQLFIRWTLPRFRYDQLMHLGWKILLPLSLANIVVTAVVVYFLMPFAR